ncbi:MAG: hypothetical protein LBK25_06900 [Treponema sp.]|nr:hypothetical protein [Treponema sp.]
MSEAWGQTYVVTGEKIRLSVLDAAYYLIRVAATYAKLTIKADEAFAVMADVTIPTNFIYPDYNR